jgi:transcriptional regulator with XRE-family HTH domain
VTKLVVNPNRTSRLRLWRKGSGLTLEDLAGLTGLSQPFLSRIERGERRLKPLDKVRVARAVGEPVRALFEPEFPVPDAPTP